MIFVDPESAAARANLRVFDVIESVDGTLLGRLLGPLRYWPKTRSDFSSASCATGRKVAIKLSRKTRPRLRMGYETPNARYAKTFV